MEGTQRGINILLPAALLHDTSHQHHYLFLPLTTMENQTAEPELLTHIHSALQCLISSSPPETIQQAQDALLRWEESHTDEYVVSLLALVGGATCVKLSGAGGDASAEEKAAATLRLAAILSLKSAIVRRWKDRGRGKLRSYGSSDNSNLLSEGAKRAVRQSMLALVLTGTIPSYYEFTHEISFNVDTAQTNYIFNANTASRQHIKLLQDQPLQTNAASLLSKLARMDLPLKFHELIPSLVEGMRNSHDVIRKINQHMQQQQPHLEHQKLMYQTIQKNSVNTLEAILSEISTQRLLVDKKYRNAIASQSLGVIVESGLIPSLKEMDDMRDEVLSSQNNAAKVVSRLDYATNISLVVSHLLSSSFGKLAAEEPTMTIVDHTLTLLHAFLSLWLPIVLGSRVASNTTGISSAIEKVIRVQCDMIAALQKTHALTFVRYLEPFIQLYYSSLANMTDNHSNSFGLVFISFLANVASESKYTPAESPVAARIVWTNFFTPSLIQPLVRILLIQFSSHIYPLNNVVNEEDGVQISWEDDPEGFHNYENVRSSECDVGSAAQNLFLALMESSAGREVILPWLIGILTNIDAQRIAVSLEGGTLTNTDAQTLVSSMPLGQSSPQADVTSVQRELISQWDAIYTAAGLSCNVMETHPSFEFAQWLHAVLSPSLELLLQSVSRQQQKLPVLRRRIIWLLSCNAHQISLSSPHNPLGMLSSVLSSTSSQNDVCVRLTAVQAFEALLPYSEDAPEALQSIVEPTITALFQLAGECDNASNQVACFELVSTMITYTVVTGGMLTNEMLNSTVASLSTIWEQSVSVKRDVLSILSSILSYIGAEQATILYPVALPMIDDTFSNKLNMYFVEDALRLWLMFLRLSKSYDPLLRKLFIRAADLSCDFDNVM